MNIMNSFFIIILIAISLSMDAFSLSLAYGMEGINNKNKLFLSLTVGIYHFIMPLIGLILSNIITTKTYIILFYLLLLFYLNVQFFLFIF